MSQIIGGDQNRRKRERLALSLPIKVRCQETHEHEWEEVTRLIDVTPFGAGFTLTRPSEMGRLLLLYMPLPRQLRCYDHLEPQYRVWCVVRHIRQANSTGESNSYTFGVAFVGKRPPASYEANPAQRYEILAPDETGLWKLQEIKEEKPDKQDNSTIKSSQSSVTDRRATRHPIPLTVTIEVFDERGATVASEVTVTENISASGARVFTTLDIGRGRFVRMTNDQYDVTLVAVVRGRRLGQDGIPRLHLEFIDREFPLAGIE